MAVKRVVLFAAVLLALGATEAQAHTSIVSPNPIYQRWVDEAKVPTPDVTVAVVEEGCPGQVEPACTLPGGPIYLGEVVTNRRHAFYHELGHQDDYLDLSDPARSRFIEIIGQAGSPWRSEVNSPNEQFAEAFAFCATIGTPARKDLRRLLGRVSEWGYTYHPNVWEQQQSCGLIRSEAS